MFDIGGGELLLILIVVLIAFGPKKLPELAQSLGRGIREFKRAQRDFTDQINTAFEQEQRRANRSTSRQPNAIARGSSPDQHPHPALEEPQHTNTIHPPMHEQAPVELPTASQVDPQVNPESNVQNQG
jgi:sec-independent protein translocase protein TatA